MMINKVMRAKEKENNRIKLNNPMRKLHIVIVVYLRFKHSSIYFKIYSVFINNHCTKIYVR